MNSETPEDLYRTALQAYREKQSVQAVQQLEEVLKLSPAFYDAREALAVIFYNEKRYDDALRILTDWIALQPESIMAHTNLSRCYVAKGMILEAEKEQAAARTLTWKAELKDKKQAMPKTNHAEQIARFKKVIEYDPADVLGYFSLGQAYLEAGQKREAVDTFEKAVEVDPKHSASFLGYGTALEELGDYEKARRIFAQGIRVAEERGDMMTQKKMEAHLRSIEGK